MRNTGICHTVLLTAYEQDQDGTRSVLILLASRMTYTIAVCTVKKTPDDGQRNCPKRVQFYFKNIFQKLVQLVGFIIRIYHDALSSERQMCRFVFLTLYQKQRVFILRTRQKNE